MGLVSSRNENFILSAKTIDVVSSICVQTLTEAGADKMDIIRIRLSQEEILGVWLESLAGALVHVDCGQRFGRAYLKISVDGPTMEAWDNEELVLSSHMLAQAGLSFTYAYKNGKNCLVCNPKKRKSSMGQIALLLGAVFLAAFLGAAVRRSPAMQSAALSVTEPLFNMILGALRAVSSPLVFLAVCCGIVSIGDLTMVGRVGKKLISRMVAGTFVLGVVMAFVADFGIPLGQVLYKPGFVVGLFTLALCMAESYGIPITPLFLFMSVLSVGLLSMALPPIPGGALSVFTVMFAQLGIPSEALALAVAVNAILDFFMTVAGVACLQVQVTLAADGVGMLDESKLKRSVS